MVDNSSTDNTVAIASKTCCNLGIKFYCFRSGRDLLEWEGKWMETLTNMYGVNRWCLVADIDELFYFRGSGLKELIKVLKGKGQKVVNSYLLDVYPKGRLEGKEVQEHLYYDYDEEFETKGGGREPPR